MKKRDDNLISEKWDIKFDIGKLQEHLRTEVISKEITRQSPSFGGWSVLSSNGDFRDGWWKGYLLYKEDIGATDKEETLKSMGGKKSADCVVETEICSRYMKYVIDTIRSYNLSPTRARIICLTAGMGSSWHTDSPEDRYKVRLHVPIVTNSECYFETRSEREHLPADGSAYFLYVNREHRVINQGTEDRYHLVMDVQDIDGVSKFHRMTGLRL